MLRAEIIATGSELLLGGRQETNSLFLTDALASVGIEVRFKSVVGDEKADIVNAVRTACRRVRVVLVTGGLGPTSDDSTRHAVARAINRPLVRNPEALEGMRLRLAQWGRTLRPQHLRQILIPSGAEVLPNPVGSAPGFWLTWKGCILAALPGVPVEAEEMFHREVLPRLCRAPALSRGQGRQGRQGRIVRRVIHSFGLIESEVERRLKGLWPQPGGVRMGLTVSPLGVSVSLTSRVARFPGPTTRGTRSVNDLNDLVRKVRRRLGTCVYGEAHETMEEIVGRRLAAGGWSIALAESCTGGLIGHRITQVPGSSDYLDRAVVCYSNTAKRELLGVPERLIRRHGAVSAEVAAAMAKGIRRRSGADIGLSVTGIAGPGGGTDRKPVGLMYVGLDSGPGPKATVTREFRFHGDRHTIKLRASQAALDVLRLHLAGSTRRVGR